MSKRSIQRAQAKADKDAAKAADKTAKQPDTVSRDGIIWGSGPQPAAQTQAAAAAQQQASRPAPDPGERLSGTAEAIANTSQSTARSVYPQSGVVLDRLAPDDAVLSGATIKVRALSTGYYGDARRRAGDVFLLRPRRGMFTENVEKNGEQVWTGAPGTQVRTRETREVLKTLSAEDQFNPRWMEKVSAATPDKVTSPNEELRRKHDEEMKARHTTGPATGDAAVLE